MPWNSRLDAKYKAFRPKASWINASEVEIMAVPNFRVFACGVKAVKHDFSKSMGFKAFQTSSSSLEYRLRVFQTFSPPTINVKCLEQMLQKHSNTRFSMIQSILTEKCGAQKRENLLTQFTRAPWGSQFNITFHQGSL